MSKPRRTVLSEIVAPMSRASSVPPPVTEGEVPAPLPARRRSATKEATIQQTVYLPPAVHDQLREVAFAERVKMHSLIMEGLDAVFRARGMKSIENLSTIKS